MNLFQKVKLVVAGNTHDLLNKIIDLNSPAAVRQYVRELETALGQLQNEAATAAGQVRTTTREKADLEGQVAHITTVIQHVLGSTDANKETVAKQQALRIPPLNQQIATLNAALAEQTKTAQDLATAVQALDQKHSQMVAQVRQLEVLDRTTKAKTHAAEALTSAGRIASGGADLSVDDITGRMRAQADVADVKFENAMGGVTALHDPGTDAEADDILAGIKAGLGK